MSYTTVSKVQSLQAAINKNAAFSVSTAPTIVQVQQFIDGISAEIDMHLGSAGYSIPATTPASFVTWLDQANQYGAIAMVLKAEFPETQGGTNGNPIIPAWSFWEKRYQDALTDIDKRVIVVPGASMGNITLPSTYLTDNPTNPGPDGSDGFTGVGYGDQDQPVFGMQTVF